MSRTQHPGTHLSDDTLNAIPLNDPVLPNETRKTTELPLAADEESSTTSDIRSKLRLSFRWPAFISSRCRSRRLRNCGCHNRSHGVRSRHQRLSIRGGRIRSCSRSPRIHSYCHSRTRCCHSLRFRSCCSHCRIRSGCSHNTVVVDDSDGLRRLYFPARG